MKKISLILILTFLGTLGSFMMPAPANAQSFQAGRIIDDSIFFNGNGMSPTQIQHFLNSKVPKCDTYHARSSSDNDSGPPYTCLKNFRQNTPSKGSEPGLCKSLSAKSNRTAAQIIYDVGQACGINQKVILVMLQKEQSLVTDTWPWKIQYDRAMGYACPDTGPNHSANCNSMYYGFFNQVYYGARQFKRYTQNPDYWGYRAYRDNYIQYNPNPACGGSNVFIQNQATANLYIYTPYQPNSATLAAAPGTEVHCGAYGNINFFRTFTKWFGSTMGRKMSGDSNYAKGPCSAPHLTSGQVIRLWHPDSSDYLYTTNPQEVCPAVRIGYIYDGIVLKSVSHNASDASPVYRLSGFGRHLFTTSSSVRTHYINQGYKSEGIGFYVYTSDQPNTTQVYCLVKGDVVIYTSSGGEKVDLMNRGFSNAGLAFLVPEFNAAQTASRFANSTHKRLYTANSVEKSLAKNFGYKHEGPGLEVQVDSAPQNDNSPLYRLRTPKATYFFTPSRIERDLAVINHGYYSEGIAFYTPGNSSIGDLAVYRITNSKGDRIFTPSLLERNLALRQYGYKSEGTGFYGYEN